MRNFGRSCLDISVIRKTANVGVGLIWERMKGEDIGNYGAKVQHFRSSMQRDYVIDDIS